MGGLQRGEQHDNSRQQGKTGNKFHRFRNLFHDRPHLFQDGSHVKHGDARPGLDEFDQRAPVLRRQVETGYIGGRIAIQCFRVGDDKEIDIERIPIDPPGAGDGPGHPLVGNLEFEPVAQGNPQGMGELLLEGKQLFSAIAPPPACRQAVVFLQGFRYGQVERAPGETFCPLIRVVVGIDRLAVNGNQACPDHRVGTRRHAGPVIDELPHRVHLTGLDVDEEIIGGIGRQPAVPVRQQVGPHQRQQGKHHETDTDGQYLRRTQASPAHDVCQAEAGGYADTRPQRVQPVNCQARAQQRRGASDRQPGKTVQDQRLIARFPGRQQHQAGNGRRIDAQGAGGQGNQVAPEYPQGRNVFQP